MSETVLVKGILKRPHGLPRWVTLDKYRANPVCYLSTRNYKIEALLGCREDSWNTVTTVLDSGAGPNLVRLDMLTEEQRSSIDSKTECVSLASASNHRLDTLGIVKLLVKIGSYVARQPFIVARQLGADVILGCTFIDHHVEAIHARQKVVELINGETVPIVRRPAGIPTSRKKEEPTRVQVDKNQRSTVKVCKATTIPPYSEAVVAARSLAEGTRLLETRPQMYDRKKTSVSNGIVNIRPNVPFHVRVGNFGAEPVTLQKGERLGIAIEAPTQIMAIHFEGDEVLPEEPPPDMEGEGLGAENANSRVSKRVDCTQDSRTTMSTIFTWNTCQRNNGVKYERCYALSRTCGKDSLEL